MTYSVGNQIGVGKESDIFVVASPSGAQHVLKIHRLGRISFRTVKANRDYLRKRSSGSWMYMSRLAALKEYAFMTALKASGFPVPQPIAQSRHTIVMEFIDAFPLRQISDVPDPAGLYAELMSIIMRLAEVGLIHGDFNEFNILVKEEGGEEVNGDGTGESPDQRGSQRQSGLPRKLTPILIDFPQMVSIDHADAQRYFDRDVNCMKQFFERRFHFTSDAPGPSFAEARKRLKMARVPRLDIEVEASGFSKKMAKELEEYIQTVEGVNGVETGSGEEDSGGSDRSEPDDGDFSASLNTE